MTFMLAWLDYLHLFQTLLHQFVACFMVPHTCSCVELHGTLHT